MLQKVEKKSTSKNGTGYKGNVVELYDAMLKPGVVAGVHHANPLIQNYLDNADYGIRILDFPCGSGHNTNAILNIKKYFQVAVGDAEPAMLQGALSNVRKFFGRDRVSESHCSTLDELTKKKEWKNKFNLILLSNVASELFGNMDEVDYEKHFIDSLIGAKHALKPDGTILIDSRDWEKTHKADWRVTTRENIHSGIKHFAKYIWTRGKNVDSEHKVTTVFSKIKDGVTHEATNNIRFAGRKIEDLVNLFNKAGLEVVEQLHEVRGNNNEPFVTFALKRKKLAIELGENKPITTVGNLAFKLAAPIPVFNHEVEKPLNIPNLKAA